MSNHVSESSGLAKPALAKTDHASVHEIPHLAFSLETGDTRGRLRGKRWQVKTMSYQLYNLHHVHRSSQNPCISHLPVVTMYLVTTPRNTDDSITKSLSAFTETREGQENHHPGTEDKYSELNENLTGQE